MQRGPETAAEMLQRAETRDDWLGVLLPVAVAGLLVLVLIIRRQRRAGTTALDGLFRPRTLPDAAAAWRTWRAKSRERERSIAALSAAEAEQLRQAADDHEARRALKVLAADGSVLLQPDQRVIVETLTSDQHGTIAYITDAGIALYLDPNPVIAWDRIRRIRVRQGPERKWWIPTLLASVGAGLLGTCGALIDALEHSTSGRDPKGEAMIWGVLIGALAAGGLGTAIMYTFRAPRWITLAEAPRGTPPLTLETFATRASETARSRPVDDTVTQRT
jgi:hypothetical protein